MDRMLYIAMEGAKQTLRSQAVNSNNLANVSTTGFRAELEAFRSLPVYGPGHDSRVYTEDQGQGVDFTQGSIVSTGRDMDFAVNGDGWIAIQAEDGSEAYTRAGDLRINESGFLVNGTGHAVLGNGGPIALPPFEKMEIGSDGTISIVPLGQEAANMAIADRIKLVKPENNQMEKGEDGLMHMADGSEAIPDAAVKISSGSLESSNVNAVQSMVKMIELGRHFELTVKAMQTAKNNDETSARLLQMS